MCATISHIWDMAECVGGGGGAHNLTSDCPADYQLIWRGGMWNQNYTFYIDLFTNYILWHNLSKLQNVKDVAAVRFVFIHTFLIIYISLSLSFFSPSLSTVLFTKGEAHQNFLSASPVDTEIVN